MLKFPGSKSPSIGWANIFLCSPSSKSVPNLLQCWRRLKQRRERIWAPLFTCRAQWHMWNPYIHFPYPQPAMGLTLTILLFLGIYCLFVSCFCFVLFYFVLFFYLWFAFIPLWGGWLLIIFKKIKHNMLQNLFVWFSHSTGFNIMILFGVFVSFMFYASELPGASADYPPQGKMRVERFVWINLSSYRIAWKKLRSLNLYESLRFTCWSKRQPKWQ